MKNPALIFFKIFDKTENFNALFNFFIFTEPHNEMTPLNCSVNEQKIFPFI